MKKELKKMRGFSRRAEHSVQSEFAPGHKWLRKIQAEGLGENLESDREIMAGPGFRNRGGSKIDHHPFLRKFEVGGAECRDDPFPCLLDFRRRETQDLECRNLKTRAEFDSNAS
jgi:hypothetical protein